jgi:hypothetical protein
MAHENKCTQILVGKSNVKDMCRADNGGSMLRRNVGRYRRGVTPKRPTSTIFKLTL